MKLKVIDAKSLDAVSFQALLDIPTNHLVTLNDNFLVLSQDDIVNPVFVSEVTKIDPDGKVTTVKSMQDKDGKPIEVKNANPN